MSKGAPLDIFSISMCLGLGDYFTPIFDFMSLGIPSLWR